MTKFIVDGIRQGFHKNVKATLMTLTSGIANPVPISPLDERKALIIFNGSGGTIYIGDSTVTGSDNQYPILNNAEWSANLSDRVILYAYCSSTASGVHVFEIA